MHYCKRCLYQSSHPFGLEIKEGLCSGCITHSEKNELDWENRRNLLIKTLLKSKNKKKGYDCVIPVVGDAEDYYVVKTVLDLKMSPLLVTVNDYFKNDIGWYNFHNLITYFDVDSVVYNPDISVYKELIRTSLRKYDHALLPFLQLHTSFPVHVATERNIPLVIWGQNQAVEQVGKFSHMDRVEMTRWYRREHDLMNIEINELTGNGAQVQERNLNYYQYPDVTKITGCNVKGLYLSNFMRWDPIAQNASMKEYGFLPEANPATFDIYERAGSSIYYRLHDLLKLKRVGYRKVDDHLVREIRHERLTKQDAAGYRRDIASNKVYIKPFFDWLNVTNSGYDWFKDHRLSAFHALIAKSYSDENDAMAPNDTLKEYLKFKKRASDFYINFGKGV